MGMELTKTALMEKDLEGKVIIFKTDTVYGIGALLDDEVAIERIFEIKKRDKNNPLAVLIGDESEVHKLAKTPGNLTKYMRAHWPGALTLVTEKSPRVSASVTRGKSTVGLRMPNDEDALDILKRFGPMAVTSLNVSSEPPVLKYDEALAFASEVDYVVQGGNLDAVASTVFDVDRSIVLRQGGVYVE